MVVPTRQRDPRESVVAPGEVPNEAVTERDDEERTEEVEEEVFDGIARTVEDEQRCDFSPDIRRERSRCSRDSFTGLGSGRSERFR
jgi:hypothetical protein